jgi:DNA-directed RNA polymerase specialized sigma24 family protein
MNLFDGLLSDDVIRQCREERTLYHSTRDRTKRNPLSPACAEVFRRAFKGDQESWAGLREGFEPTMRAWIGSQSIVDPEDVMQEAFLAFSRAAPNHSDMVKGDDLRPVMKFWQKCTRTALLQMVRRIRFKEVILEDSIEHIAQSDSADSVVLRMILRECLGNHIQTEEEQFVFQLFYIQGLKQEQILALHPDRFLNKDDLNNVIQRITRRMRADDTLQSLRSSVPLPRQNLDNQASLQMKRLDLNDGEDQNDMTIQCGLNEEVLVDYVLGIASAALCAEVERSPACVAAAARIADEIQGLMALFQAHACPDPATLISYADQELPSLDLLIIRKHVDKCSLCREEIELLTSLGSGPPELEIGFVRRVVEAIFRPALELQILGSGMLVYETPDILINLSLSPEPRQERRWILQGELRTPDGLSLEGVGEVVYAERLEPKEPPMNVECAVEPDGSFLFEKLVEGHYRLIIRLADQDVTIRQIVVGDLA